VALADEDFSEAALVLIGHGSTVNQQSGQPVRRLAEELAARNLFAQVSTAFDLEAPKIEDVPRIDAPRIFVVPITISAGRFTEETIPQRLGLTVAGQSDYDRVQEINGRQVIYCHPIGAHPGMIHVLLERARSIVTQHPFPHAPEPTEMALFIAGHGTRKNKNSRKSIEAQVDLIRARSEYADVQPAFMEEAPFIADCYTATEARHMVVVPFFISGGLHTLEDIPILLGESEAAVKERLAAGQTTWSNPTQRNGKLVWYTPAIGNEPSLQAIVLERVSEMTEVGQ
jgi:sirohydrochlorin cobaltochelatase|tara:strand:- start:551 stop:1405 length:855 start_codon:yes stop_codon:yes gene_type:complete